MVIQPLDSADNKIMRQVKRLSQSHTARKKSGETVIEGPHLIEEALAAGLSPRLVVYSPRWVERAEGRSFLTRLAARSVHLFYVTDRLFEETSQVETPQGILAVIPVPQPLDFEALWEKAPGPYLLPAAVGIQDPGNLGTLIRAALAAGAQAFIIGPGTVEPFNPKCIRASAGASFRLPMIQGEGQWVQALADRGVSVRATAVDRGRPYFEVPWEGSAAVLLGNEGSGLADDWLRQAEVVTIPMSPASESLNVAMAGAVLLFHAAYRRQAAGVGFAPPAVV
jgi:TrmH family RNA methyltransferase